MQTWHDVAALVAVVVTLLGVGLGVQWLYYWPKVQDVVKAAVTDAMSQEHAYVIREVERLDRAREVGDIAIAAKILSVENDVTANLSYIRSRIDWLVDCMIKRDKEGKHGVSD